MIPEIHYVRPFNPILSEYTSIVSLYNELWPDEKHFPLTSWQENDFEWPPSSLHQRFVLQSGDEIIGYGGCYEKYWQHQPGTVFIEFHIHPSCHEQRLNELLYEAIVSYLRRRGQRAEIIATEAREDRQERIAFLTSRGFKPVMRSPRSSLLIADFEGTRFADLPQKLAAEHVEISSLSQLQSQMPDWKQRLYDLRWAIVKDVPAVEAPSQPTMGEFERMILQDPALNEDAWFIAVDRSPAAYEGSGLWIGLSNLWPNDPDHVRIDAGLTGVRRAYRQRGIATALKLRTIQFADQLGAKMIETDNEENNPMYELNLKLGFRPRAAWVSYRRSFT